MVLGGEGGDDLEAGHVAVPGREALGVLGSHACWWSVGASEHDWAVHLYTYITQSVSVCEGGGGIIQSCHYWVSFILVSFPFFFFSFILYGLISFYSLVICSLYWLPFHSFHHCYYCCLLFILGVTLCSFFFILVLFLCFYL